MNQAYHRGRLRREPSLPTDVARAGNQAYHRVRLHREPSLPQRSPVQGTKPTHRCRPRRESSLPQSSPAQGSKPTTEVACAGNQAYHRGRLSKEPSLPQWYPAQRTKPTTVVPCSGNQAYHRGPKNRKFHKHEDRLRDMRNCCCPSIRAWELLLPPVFAHDNCSAQHSRMLNCWSQTFARGNCYYPVSSLPDQV